MNETLPEVIAERLKDPFSRLIQTENLGKVKNEVIELIYQGKLDSSSLEKLLHQYNISSLDSIKIELLEVLLAYIDLTLNDNFITSEEAENVHYLKRIFKIKEGDFYSYKYSEVENVLDRQFRQMYRDDKIDNTEAIQKVELQELFNLGYDQFLQISEKAVRAALDRGANPIDLDTFIKLN